MFPFSSFDFHYNFYLSYLVPKLLVGNHFWPTYVWKLSPTAPYKFLWFIIKNFMFHIHTKGTALTLLFGVFGFVVTLLWEFFMVSKISGSYLHTATDTLDVWVQVQIASRSVQGIQSPVEMMKHASY
jgi:hypothetical protein